MAESAISEVGKALSAGGTGIIPGVGGFSFKISTDNVEVVREVCKTAVTLGALYTGYKLVKPLIDVAVKRALGGERDDQEVRGVKPGSSVHVQLQCFTHQRFLEVLEEYEPGRIKERLLQEFSQVGIRVEGLKVEIENMVEVNKTKEAIKKRQEMAESQQAEGNNTPAIGSHKEQKIPCIIVQGGAYCSPISEHVEKDNYERVTKEAVRAGYAELMKEGESQTAAVDAVVAAVRVFEDCPLFNAGRGSSLNSFGEVECDAMVMEHRIMKNQESEKSQESGKSKESKKSVLNTGAVMSVCRILNPVELARKVMDDSHHCALSGEGALEFARKKNVPICNPQDLKGHNRNQKLVFEKKHYEEFVQYRYKGESLKERQTGGHTENQTGDTVSAVAMDAEGHLACATSSGGVSGKLKGRVGDVPLVGCGGYANEYGAATTTGYGESIMKVTLAREVVFNMELERGMNAEKSAKSALDKMERLVNGRGGVIAIDKDGNFGLACNTTSMIWARIKDSILDYGMAAGTVYCENLKTI